MAHDLAARRQQLIDTLQKIGIVDKSVLEAIVRIPREFFIDESQRAFAYDDRALPIDMGQTISQPQIIATMTQALQLKGSERVLEIGTGTGYQTAILAYLAGYVYSIERYPELAYTAAKRLNQLNIQNVSIYVGDGSLGWPEAAPYERILVTAAAPEVPANLVDQLELWGMLVIPVGSKEKQELLVVHRAPWGAETRSLGSCVFVPLIGQQGWQG